MNVSKCVKTFAAAMAVAVVMAATAAAQEQSWPCGAAGSNLTCTKDGGTLTISGTGAMEDYAEGGSAVLGVNYPAPWGTVTAVVVESGVTYLGKNAFYTTLQEPLISVTLLAETPSNVNDSAFEDGIIKNADLFVPNSAVSNYSTAPVWRDFAYINPHDVTFNSKGGTEVSLQKLSYGKKATNPADPTRQDYTFGGWYKDEAFANAWDFTNDAVTEDITLFAKWTSTTSVLAESRVIPQTSKEEAAVIAPVTIVAGEITAGPNPVGKSSGGISFFRQGKRVSGTLSIYDGSGNLIKKISVKDNAVNTQSKRNIALWDLTDKKGRQVSEGTYLVKGALKTSDGKSEKVSVIVGVR